MATHTRPCPYCGAAVMSSAPHCGNCGRPVAPAPQPPQAAVPAKTIFGYQAPKIAPGQPGGPAPLPPLRAPTGGPPGPRPGSSTAPPAYGAPPPAAAPAYGANVPPSQPYGGVPQQPASAAPTGPMPGAPTGPYAGAPTSPMAGPPTGPHGYGEPPAPYGQPPAAQPHGYGPPPAAAPPAYGPAPAAAPHGYGQPPAPYGQPPGAQPHGYAPPPPYGQPPAAAPHGYGQPAYGSAPPAPYGQPPAAGPHGYGQPAYGSAPPAPYGQPPTAAPHGYGQPPAGYGQPPAGYGQPPAGYGQPPAAAPYGQLPGAPPQGYAPPPSGYGAPPGAPPPGSGQVPPAYVQPGAGDGLANFAAKLPRSAPGTLFGFQLERLRDPALQRKVLLVSGVALLVSIVIPILWIEGFKMWSWSEGARFRALVWPLLAGLSYLLVAAAPPDIKQRVPPLVLRWLPFVVALLGVGLVGWGLGALAFVPGMAGDGGAAGLLTWAYPILLFGLFLRLTNPSDAPSRWIVGLGAILCAPAMIQFAIDVTFKFSGVPALFIIHNILFQLVLIAAVGCIVFALPPGLVPALRGVDALTPHATALLVLWLPVQAILIFLLMATGLKLGFSAVLLTFRALIGIVAYFGVLILTAPEAYEEAKRLMAGQGGAPGGYGGPPPGYGGPPPGGYGGPPPGYGGPPLGYGGPPPQ